MAEGHNLEPFLHTGGGAGDLKRGGVSVGNADLFLENRKCLETGEQWHGTGSHQAATKTTTEPQAPGSPRASLRCRTVPLQSGIRLLSVTVGVPNLWLLPVVATDSLPGVLCVCVMCK